jgi:hypothetical protein
MKIKILSHLCASPILYIVMAGLVPATHNHRLSH